MKIGIVLTSIGVLPGHERNVSGHVQIPLRTAQLLVNNGHEVHLISTRMADADAMPIWVPERCHVHITTDGRKRGHLSDVVHANQVNGYRPLKLLQQLWELWRIVKKHDLDVVHFFGFERMIRLAGLFRLIGPGVPTVASVLGRHPAPSWKWLYRKIDRIITATQSVQGRWESMGLRVDRVPHGILRDLAEELAADDLRTASRYRVLFWREADLMSGADLCIRAFGQLANQFPNRVFTFALRRNSAEVPGLDELVRRHSNVEVYRFPYPATVSLAKLMAESVCVVLPFRDLTIQPQLTVAETLAFGVPVITTQVESMPELVHHGHSGLVVPSGDGACLKAAIVELLNDESRAREMGDIASAEFAREWNWQLYMEALGGVYSTVCRAGTFNISRSPEALSKVAGP